jgi:DNA-binding LacI/PurR family transcriptional regulator
MALKRKPQRVTASRIAEVAGVSAATVSLVLNRRGDDLRINRDTQQRVLEAARQLNYVPNYLARGLSGGSTRSIGVIWPLGGAPYNAGIAYQLVQRFAKRGYLTFQTDHLSDAKFTCRALVDLAQRRVDGLVFYAGAKILDNPEMPRLLGEFKSVVVISARDVPLDVDLILHDRRPPMRQIGKILPESHTRPVFRVS